MRKCGIIMRISRGVLWILYIAFLVMFGGYDSCFANDKLVASVATSPDYPPFSFYQNNQLVGFEIDLLELIERRVGNIEFRIHTVDFNAIIAGVSSGKFDLAISGISHNKLRERYVNFSKNYYTNEIELVSKNDYGKEISIANLSNKVIGVQSGTEIEAYLTKYFKHNNINAKIIAIANNNNLVTMIQYDKVDVIIADKFFIDTLQKKSNKFFATKVVNDDNSDIVSSFAIIFNKKFKHNQLISDAINDLIIDGTIDRLKDKWFVHSVDNTFLFKKYLWIVGGIVYTICYTIVAFSIGFTLALFLTFIRFSEIGILQRLVKLYVSVLRGTPLLLQLSIIYFVLPLAININLSVFNACIIAFSLNSSAYIIEILRSGVDAVHRSQFEIATSLGLSKLQTYRDIVMPQVLKKNIPNLLNEVISLSKESSIVSFIGGVDIMRRANIVAMELYDYFGPLFIAGVAYYMLSFTLEVLANFFEKRNSL